MHQLNPELTLRSYNWINGAHVEQLGSEALGSESPPNGPFHEREDEITNERVLAFWLSPEARFHFMNLFLAVHTYADGNFGDNLGIMERTQPWETWTEFGVEHDLAVCLADEKPDVSSHDKLSDLIEMFLNRVREYVVEPLASIGYVLEKR